MNKTEKEMLDVLKELRDEHGVIAVKAEFEAEGSRTDELVQLNQIVFRADMNLFIKIGGCEAVRDMDQCRLLGATGIMAPMIETPFAMSKFVGAAQKVYKDQMKDIEWIINTETKTCEENVDEIFKAGEGMLDTIAIGRVDLSASMGLSRADIDGEAMLKETKYLANKAKDAGLIVGMGGGISFDAIPFLQEMYPLIDKFETRKIVFKAEKDEKKLKSGILKAMEFEVLYLENKCNFYGRMANEDKSRMEMLRQRHANAVEQMK